MPRATAATRGTPSRLGVLSQDSPSAVVVYFQYMRSRADLNVTCWLYLSKTYKQLGKSKYSPPQTVHLDVLVWKDAFMYIRRLVHHKALKGGAVIWFTEEIKPINDKNKR